MNKVEVGGMLAEVNIEADQIAKMPGVQGVHKKVPITAMLIQNLHEALLALDKGVDVTGVTISPEQISEGLFGMLTYLRENSHWTKLQEGLDVPSVNKIVKFSGKVRGAANALRSIT